MNISFFVSLVLILLLQYALQFLLMALNFSMLWINIIIDLVLAFTFAFVNFRGREKLKNPDFHKTVVIYFVILTVFSFLFGAYF